VSNCVLDASALLAYLHGEVGAVEVAEAIAETATISAANWAETLSKLTELGDEPRQITADLEEQGVLHGLLEVEPLTAEDAPTVAELRSKTRARGFGLGDRACLALALRLGLPVLTADRDWLEIERLGVEVRPIRP
jgi:PIN domain nuclease of toxin-antitoxin system